MKPALWIKLVYLLSAILLVVYFVFAWLAPDYKGNIVFDVIQYSCLASAITIMTIVTIWNYIIGSYVFKSYEELVKKRINKYLDKLNKEKYLSRGLEWYAVPNHYWMELRIHSAKSNGQNNNSRPQIFSPTSSVMDQKGGYSIVANPLPQFEEEKRPGIIGIKGSQANHDIDMRK